MILGDMLAWRGELGSPRQPPVLHGLAVVLDKAAPRVIARGNNCRGHAGRTDAASNPSRRGRPRLRRYCRRDGCRVAA